MSKRARGGSGARSAARPRAAGSPSIPRSARCSTTAAAWQPPASTAPRTASSCRSGPTGCSSAASTRSSGTSPPGSCPCTSGSTTPRGGRAVATTAPSASARPSPGSLRRRWCAFVRSPSSISCARLSRTLRRAAARTRSVFCPRSKERRASPTGTRSRRFPVSPRSRPIRTGSTGTKQQGRSCAALRGSCGRRPTATASARSSGCRASASRATTSPTSRPPSPARARRASAISGRGAMRRAGT